MSTVRIIWRCDDCLATFDDTAALGTHRRTAHHPLTQAIEYLASRIGSTARAGGTPQLDRSRRVLLGLIGERAADLGLSTN